MSFTHSMLLLLGRVAVVMGLVWSVGQARPAAAQTGPRITLMPVPEYVFGQGVTFRLEAQGEAPIIEANLYVQTPGAARTFVGKATFEAGPAITAAYVLDPSRRALEPFVPVAYWWEVRDQAGALTTSDRQTFTYADNRFAWQALSEGPLTVYWYAGDRAFAQAALDSAKRGLQTASRDLRVAEAEIPPQMAIYLYAQKADVDAVFSLVNRAWVDGRAYPEYGVVVVTAPPDGLDTLTRLDNEIPHELAHLLIYQITQANYANVPTWLNEGLATMFEPSPNAEAGALLAAARQAEALPSLAVLCGPFPAGSAEAQLAYVQSASVVQYIHDRYGVSALRGLLEAYADGLACSSGVERVLGVPLAELDQRWRQDTFRTPTAAALPVNTWAAYTLIAVLITFGATTFFMLLLLRRPKPAGRVV